MKNYTLAIAFAAVLALTGCGNSNSADKDQGNKPAAELTLESYSYSRIAKSLVKDSIPTDSTAGGRLLYVSYTGEGVLPKASADPGITALRDTLLKLAHISINEEGAVVPEVDKDVELTDLPATTDACSEVDGKLIASLIGPKVAVFEFRGYSYACRAAHGLNGVEYLNYSIPDGKILSLADIVSASSGDVLNTLIQNKVKSMGISLLTELKDIEAPKTFAVTSSGLAFSYQPYEIAPYSEGVITVELDYPTLSKAKVLTQYGETLLSK